MSKSILMAILSLVPGLGQLCSGQILKGIAILIVMIILLKVALIPMPIIGAAWILNMFDSFMVAKKIKSGKKVKSWEFFRISKG